MEIEFDKRGNLNFWRIGDFDFGYQEIDKSRLLQEGYSMNAYVYMIVNRIAEQVASLPYKFCDDKGNEIESAEIYEFFKLLDRCGGKKIFLEKLSANLVALGEFFVIKQESVGFEGLTSGLDIVSPASVEPESVSGYGWDNDIKYFQITDYYKKYSKVLPENMIFGKYPNIKNNTNRGLSPFEPLWDVVQASNNAFKAHGQLIKNMGANGILSAKDNNIESVPMDDKERSFLQKGLDKILGSFGAKKSRYTAENFGKTIVSKTPVNWVQLGFDPAKLQVLEMNKDNLKVMSAACNLDSKIFNDAEASTYNNIHEVTKSAYINCFIPTANYIYKTLSDALLPDEVNWLVDTERIDVLKQRDQSREKETREGIIAIQNQVAENKISVRSASKMLEVVYGYSENLALELLEVNVSTPNETIQIDDA